MFGTQFGYVTAVVRTFACRAGHHVRARWNLVDAETAAWLAWGPYTRAAVDGRIESMLLTS